MSKILLVATAADSLTLADGSEHATGFWAEELVVAHRELTAAGHDVVIATPGGKAAPVDPGSLAVANVGSEEAVAELSSYLDGIAAELKAPLALNEAKASDYAAIVLPGGHGPMTDLAFDATLGAILIEANDNGTVIAPFCHGPAGLLSASQPDGSFAFAGRKLTVFTDEEERTGGLGDNTPWFVASKLREQGAVTEAGAAWSSFVVRDGNLISGQNPQSSAAVAAAVVEALQA